MKEGQKEEGQKEERKESKKKLNRRKARGNQKVLCVGGRERKVRSFFDVH